MIRLLIEVIPINRYRKAKSEEAGLDVGIDELPDGGRKGTDSIMDDSADEEDEVGELLDGEDDE